MTILIVVATINAVNFIDGLDGLAAGVVGISALAFMVYSYTLTNSVGIPSQSVPAVVSAVLAGICIGFLPHNFNPARIFMGDTGAMLLGLLLAYGPISSTATLDQNILVNYASNKPVDRFATILPLLLPVAILIIPYTDLLLAVVRRMLAGQSPFAADRQHLHHRLQNMGHSHRQTVLLMYLWAALFSGTVVGLSVIRVPLIWLALATVGAVIALVLATMPKLRPWRSTGKRAAGTQEPSPDRSHPGPFDRANSRRQRPGRRVRGPALNGRRRFSRPRWAHRPLPPGRSTRRTRPHRSARRTLHPTARRTSHPTAHRTAIGPPRRGRAATPVTQGQPDRNWRSPVILL